ncbi:MAG: hypothetical protein AB7G38_15920 [Dehalococcoidia bacterium]
MSNREGNERRDASNADNDQAGQYEIRLEGHLDSRWSTWFDGLTIDRQSNGSTVIRGHVADQAALHGLLQRIRDLGVELVSVNRLKSD